MMMTVSRKRRRTVKDQERKESSVFQVCFKSDRFANCGT